MYDRTHLMPMLGGATIFGLEPLAGDNSRAMQLTGWTIGELARRVRADGGCLIVAWQPVAGVPGGTRTPSEAQAEEQISLHAPLWPTLAPRMFVELRDATRPIFAAGQAMELDATGAFEAEPNPVYQEDGVHYTTLGNLRVAEALQAALNQPTCR
jgi:hypothetical protein